MNVLKNIGVAGKVVTAPQGEGASERGMRDTKKVALAIKEEWLHPRKMQMQQVMCS